MIAIKFQRFEKRKIALIILAAGALTVAAAVVLAACYSIVLAATEIINELGQPIGDKESAGEDLTSAGEEFEASSQSLRESHRKEMPFEYHPLLMGELGLKRSRSQTEAGHQPAGSSVVSGVVLRRGLGTPLPRVPLCLIDESKTVVARTSADRKGRFRFNNLRAGIYRLEDASPNFISKPRSIRLETASVVSVRFLVEPGPMEVRIPRYTEYSWPAERPSVPIRVYRYRDVKYRLYKLDLSEIYVNIVSLKDLLRTNTALLKPISTAAREYTYLKPFSEVSDIIEFDLSAPGLYLLEARSGSGSFRGLLSLSELKVRSVRSPYSIRAVVLAGPNVSVPSLLVKAAHEGVLVAEKRPKSDGGFSVDFSNADELELLVSDGTSLVYIAPNETQTELSGSY